MNQALQMQAVGAVASHKFGISLGWHLCRTTLPQKAFKR